MYVHPDDAADRLADIKATGASMNIDVVTSRSMPRGSAIVFDPELIRKRFLEHVKADAERRFLGNIETWKPRGILSASDPDDEGGSSSGD